ncbi:hypothetical protein FGO68_gene9354 [Halteria grandinella]|uniref:Uncharacterized protein n=1 Tax=Halteria grandinella TaxID=5974 RepID=A0A8J8P5C7_HALGN|nr:hypothetical protein FGO68_gene9354 [Halteria grandinella]
MGGATSVTEEDTGNMGGNGTTSNDVSSEPSARQDKNEESKVLGKRPNNIVTVITSSAAQNGKRTNKGGLTGVSSLTGTTQGGFQSKSGSNNGGVKINGGGFINTAGKGKSGQQPSQLTKKQLDEFNKANGTAAGASMDIDSLSEDGQQAVLDLFQILMKTYKSISEPQASINQHAMIDTISGKGSANAAQALKRSDGVTTQANIQSKNLSKGGKKVDGGPSQVEDLNRTAIEAYNNNQNELNQAASSVDHQQPQHQPNYPPNTGSALGGMTQEEAALQDQQRQQQLINQQLILLASQHPEMQTADFMNILQQFGITDPSLISNAPFIELLLKQQMGIQDSYQVIQGMHGMPPGYPISAAYAGSAPGGPGMIAKEGFIQPGMPQNYSFQMQKYSHVTIAYMIKEKINSKRQLQQQPSYQPQQHVPSQGFAPPPQIQTPQVPNEAQLQQQLNSQIATMNAQTMQQQQLMQTIQGQTQQQAQMISHQMQQHQAQNQLQHSKAPITQQTPQPVMQELTPEEMYHLQQQYLQQQQLQGGIPGGAMYIQGAPQGYTIEDQHQIAAQEAQYQDQITNELRQILATLKPQEQETFIRDQLQTNPHLQPFFMRVLSMGLPNQQVVETSQPQMQQHQIIAADTQNGQQQILDHQQYQMLLMQQQQQAALQAQMQQLVPGWDHLSPQDQLMYIHQLQYQQ